MQNFIKCVVLQSQSKKYTSWNPSSDLCVDHSRWHLCFDLRTVRVTFKNTDQIFAYLCVLLAQPTSVAMAFYWTHLLVRKENETFCTTPHTWLNIMFSLDIFLFSAWTHSAAFFTFSVSRRNMSLLMNIITLSYSFYAFWIDYAFKTDPIVAPSDRYLIFVQ